MKVTSPPVLARAAVLGLLLTFLAGCGSSSGAATVGATSNASASAAATISIPAGVKEKFLASEVTAITAIQAGGRQLRKLPASFTGAQLSQDLAPMVSATVTFDSRLSALPWPSGFRPLVTSLVTANQAWIAAATRLDATGRVPHTDVAKTLGPHLIHEVRALNRLLIAVGEPRVG
jgi:hypothetical protein